MLLLFALVIGCYAFYMFASQQAITGWTSLMLVIAFVAAGLSGLAAILAKYLDLLLGLVFRRRTYVVAGIEKIGMEMSVEEN